ncbi:MAG: hypothetical protein NTY66_03795 [Candidatus Vogelbacteria bacterium]|nr:hypothetical protein [Candidatus Vogelbacteria bacterium]
MKGMLYRATFDLTKEELAVFRALKSPIKIQDFIDSFPRNMEKNGETQMSPRRVLREQKMHCFEGALFAAAALWIAGEPPLVLDLRATTDDYDHVIAVYRRNGYWGAISKTNYATLRFRDPVYRNMRELALSYFHEYFIDSGKKTLRECSCRPFDLRQFGTSWLVAEDDLDDIGAAIDDAPHQLLLPPENRRHIRPADQMEKRAGALQEWDPADPRT